MAQELIRLREAKAGATASGATAAAGKGGETVTVSGKNAEKKAAGAKNCC